MFDRLVQVIATTSVARPWLPLLAAAVLSVPAAWQARGIRLNPDLTALLADDSPSVKWARELDAAVGDGGYFSVLFEGESVQVLRRAIDATARQVEACLVRVCRFPDSPRAFLGDTATC